MEYVSFTYLEAENIDDCLDHAYLTTMDRWIFWIGGSFALLASLFLIVGFIRFKELRKPPGDIILGISLSDLVLSAHWIVIAIWPKQVADPTFCTTIGIFSTTAGINEFLYNLSFCFFMIISLRNALTQSKVPRKTFHVINILCSGCYVTFLLANHFIGRTLFGTCSIKSSCKRGFFSYFGGMLVALFVLVGGYTYYYIRKYTPKCSQALAKRTSFLLYYLRYIICASFIFLAIAVTNFFYVGLSSGTEDSNDSRWSWIQSVGNAAKLCTPLVLSLIRYNDPFIKKIMKRVIFFWRKDCQSVSNISGLGRGTSLEPGDISLEAKSQSFSSEFMFNSLSSGRKIEITYTLLSGVLYSHINQRNKQVEESVTSNKHTRNIYKHEKVYMIDDKLIKDTVPTVKEELEKSYFSILPGTLKVYAPEVFEEFIKADEDFLCISQSLDFNSNREEIKDASGGDGGKSGEFFFFSKDRKLIIKTIPDLEKQMLVSILERYVNHFKEHPNTLISKIYGIYTFENQDLDLKFNLILIKNICGFSKNYIERAYDLKGSSYDREVLKTGVVNSKEELKIRVLKDKDFEKFETKLYIQQEIAEGLRRQIEIDSLFFRKVKLIDYSLMIFYINKKKYWEENGKDAQDHTAKNPLASIPSEKEEGIYYNIGIIDYLQPYNFEKKLEKYFKKFQRLDINLDTSTQDPLTYSNRFIEFVRRITS